MPASPKKKKKGKGKEKVVKEPPKEAARGKKKQFSSSTLKWDFSQSPLSCPPSSSRGSTPWVGDNFVKLPKSSNPVSWRCFTKEKSTKTCTRLKLEKW